MLRKIMVMKSVRRRWNCQILPEDGSANNKIIIMLCEIKAGVNKGDKIARLSAVILIT
jgi:hypothetical protein